MLCHASLSIKRVTQPVVWDLGQRASGIHGTADVWGHPFLCSYNHEASAHHKGPALPDVAHGTLMGLGHEACSGCCRMTQGVLLLE